MTEENSAVEPIDAPRVFVAMPVYSGVHPATMMSIVRMLGSVRAYFSVSTLTGTLLAWTRSGLVEQFLKSAYEYLLFVDADCAFKPETVARLLAADRDIIGALFAQRNAQKLEPLRDAILRGDPHWRLAGRSMNTDVPSQEVSAANPIAVVDTIGCGLTLIKRCVIQRMIAAHPELLMTARDAVGTSETRYHLFAQVFRDGVFFGEDGSFCQRWRDLGGKIHALLDADTVHYGDQGVEINAWQKILASSELVEVNREAAAPNASASAPAA